MPLVKHHEVCNDRWKMAVSILTDGKKASFSHRTHDDLESSDITTWVTRWYKMDVESM